MQDRIGSWDHSSHPVFYQYYESESESPETRQRFLRIRDMLIMIGGNRENLDVADIGCGAGSQCRLWAAVGHRVTGIDVSQAFIDLARSRATVEGLDIDFRIGSATAIPLPEKSVDVCLVPELLEHVRDWRSCIREFDRIMKPGGLLYLSTTNKLCPVQQEFELPLYSWYPGFVKRRFERLAMTTQPELANYAKYPAVNWFSYYGLKSHLARYGFSCLDRFDTMRPDGRGMLERVALSAIRSLPPLRLLAHFATPYTAIVAIKRE